jgi:extracellular factor (EF) 3-hydroxypalmitic acid methyl ester biosynthesis protein
MIDSTVLSGSNLKTDDIKFLKYLVGNGGPERSDFDKYTSLVNKLDPSFTEDFREIIKPVLVNDTLAGHAFRKPYGYPGDFALIDHIYQFYYNEDRRYRKWDDIFQNQPAVNAVRNRKEYFIKQLKIIKTQNKRDINVLILGSGPATDVNEFLTDYPDRNISFDLLDFDQCAIDFSMKKNEKFNKQISYKRINVLRFKPYKMYDLIWSAGLFDYFKDKHFVYLLQKYMSCLAEDGEFVISNFSNENPTRKIMEIMLDWFLNHRSKSDLQNIALEAGIDKKMVKIDTEPLGINLFLRIRQP